MEQLIETLRSRLGDRVTTGSSELETHSHDESWHAPAAPDVVVYPESVEEVSFVAKTCFDAGVPIVPFGAGSALEGHVQAVKGGVTVDMTHMNQVLEVNVMDLDCKVQAGITRHQLSDRLTREGVFFPVDPGADATIGGMAATRASGTTTVKYGAMRENVMGLTVVLADGRVVTTGSRARKSAAGYDLTRVFLGSEGTLGIICELRLRLYGIPEQMSAAICAFDNLADAVQTATEIVQLGIPVARVELLDENAILGANMLGGYDYPLIPHLFFEFHGTEVAVKDASEQAALIAESNNGKGFAWSTDEAERRRLWRARHELFYAAQRHTPGSKVMVADACVPVSELVNAITTAKAAVSASGLLGGVLGHVGDGNFHVNIILDVNDSDAIAKAKDVIEGISRHAIEVGGSCTGEHGVGLGKQRWLELEAGETGIDTMRAIKSALDPKGILNPGKIFGEG